MLTSNNEIKSPRHEFLQCTVFIRGDSCIQIPPPIPLIATTAPPKTMDSMTSDTKRKPDDDHDATSYPPKPCPFSTKRSFLKNAREVSTLLKQEDIVRFLHQFGEYFSYHKYGTLVVNGYIRSTQTEIKCIIPSVIDTMCCSFFYEEEYRYIHFLLKVYETLRTKGANKVSGNELVSIIKNLCVLSEHSTILKICTNCVKFDFIELISYKTNFMSLFDESAESAPLFTVSDDFVYAITESTVEAFNVYLSSKN